MSSIDPQDRTDLIGPWVGFGPVPLWMRCAFAGAVTAQQMRTTESWMRIDFPSMDCWQYYISIG